MTDEKYRPAKFIFNNTEEYWFSSWVVMRRKWKIANSNFKEAIKDVQSLSKELEELKATINQSQEAKDRRTKADILGAEERKKSIQQFNAKNNKGRNYKRKRINKRWL